jgi:hypothetical protein
MAEAPGERMEIIKTSTVKETRQEEVAGAVVIYDLPSGYISAIRDEKLKALFIRARSKCSFLLRRNGINITEGVLLVPKERIPETEGAIKAIKMIYFELWKKAEEAGIEGLSYGDVEPLLLMVKLTEDQFEVFREVARKRLLESYSTAVGYLTEAAKKAGEVSSEEELDRFVDRIYSKWEYFKNRATAVAPIVPEAELKLREVEEAARAVLRAAKERARPSP